MSRSKKEERETTLGTGLLDRARRAMGGRTRDLDRQIEEQTQGKAPKKKKGNGY